MTDGFGIVNLKKYIFIAFLNATDQGSSIRTSRESEEEF